MTTLGFAQQKESSVGRFQLFQGAYNVLGIDNVERTYQALIKLDTSTGQMFICSGSAIDGKAFNKPDKVVTSRGCSPFEYEVTYDKDKNAVEN